MARWDGGRHIQRSQNWLKSGWKFSGQPAGRQGIRLLRNIFIIGFWA
jgi:hypothetical protein